MWNWSTSGATSKDGMPIGGRLNLPANNGNKPLPVERKRALGNPGHQKLPAVASVTALPQLEASPLVPLGVAGQRWWDQLMATCRPWVAASDLSMVLELCRAADRRAEMEAVVAAEGMSLQSPNGAFQAHPLLAHIRDIEKRIDQLAAAFGLTPASRGQIGAGEVKAASQLEALRAKHRGGS